MQQNNAMTNSTDQIYTRNQYVHQKNNTTPII